MSRSPQRSAHLFALRQLVFAGVFFSVGVAFAVLVQALLVGGRA